MRNYTEELQAYHVQVRDIRKKAVGLNQGGLELAVKYALMSLRNVLFYNLMNIKELVYFS